MKTIYIDTSAFICMIFHQLDYKEIIQQVNHASDLVSSSLIAAEVMTTCVREKFDLNFLKPILGKINLIQHNNRLENELTNIVSTKPLLKGADAYHLACALFLDPSAKNIYFLSRDDDQNRVAKKLGFSLL